MLATTGGAGGRRAAVNGLAATGLTSAVVNLILKPLGRRRRPDRELHRVPLARQVETPRIHLVPIRPLGIRLRVRRGRRLGVAGGGNPA